MNKTSYFVARNIESNFYQNYTLPHYLQSILTCVGGGGRILDFGCGFGQNLLAIRAFLKSQKLLNITSISGIEIDQQAIDFCLSQELNVKKIENIFQYFPSSDAKYDLIILSHVLEHFPKNQIIPLLSHLKNHLLSTNGKLLIMVPNAQSNTGCYWAYEDFTHETLFTAGSLIYVLKMSGFQHTEIIDPNCIEGINIFKKLLRITLLKYYSLKINFWNKITSSAFHAPSPRIYSYEIKMLAY